MRRIRDKDKCTREREKRKDTLRERGIKTAKRKERMKEGLVTDLVFLLSLAAFPANSSTSAARYSITAARYTGAPAPTRSA